MSLSPAAAAAVQASVDVGTPSPEFKVMASQGWTLQKVCYHGFSDLSTTRGVPVVSPEFECVGRKWRLGVFPGGYSNSSHGMVGVALTNQSDRSIKIELEFCVKDSSSNIIRSVGPTSPVYFAPYGLSPDAKGFSNFDDRSTLMNSLVAGALVIEVQMKLAEPLKMSTDAFVPENPFFNAMLKTFNDEESTNVVFKVGGEKERKNNSRKEAKTGPEPATFYAHKFILKKCAGQLAELCGSGGKDAPVFITDVKPDIFRCLLQYVYGGEPADLDLKTNAKEIIEAADKYGIGNLKLEAEAYLVKSTTITAENMMEHLLYADAKNCALLKEAVMDYIVENNVEVLEKVPLKDIPGGATMFADILAAVARGQKKDGNEKGGEDHLSTMRISDLRVKVHEKGLDVDGSREMLIAALNQTS